MTFLETVQIDALTQIPNRAGWLTAVQKSLDLSASQKGIQAKAVLFIDLDRFKWVNDTLGHDAGDELLVIIADLLTSLIDLEGDLPDIAGRFGGDEFVLLLQSPESMSCLDSLANKIVDLVSQPICLQKITGSEMVEVEIGASVGIASYPQDGLALDDLLKQSDLAMYRAKHSGRNQVVFYKPEMMRQIERRRHIQSQLRTALKEETLSLAYRPKYDCLSQSVMAIEGELDLENSPALAGLDVADLLSIADESQVSIKLGEWMIQQALAFNRKLAQLGLEVLIVLEVRPNHFQQKEFVNWLSAQLDRYDVPAELLVLSLNEACLNGQRFPVVNQLKALSLLGVEIAIQDFGAARGSLLRLHDWPIDRLHLSSRFVQQIGQSGSMDAMTGALIRMGQALNKKVAAYGVTSAEQVEFLNSHQCYLMQGSFFSEAFSESQIESCLLEKNIDSLFHSSYMEMFSFESKVEKMLDRGEIKRNRE